MRHAFRLFGVLLAVTIVVAGGRASAQPHAVYVFAKADADGFVDADSKARQDSVSDVKKALADKKFKDVFVVVDDPEQARLRIEVAFRGAVETDSTAGSATLIPGTNTALKKERRISQNNLRLDVSIGNRTQQFWALETGKRDLLGNIPHLTWSDQAKRAVEKIAEWTHANAAAIVRLTQR